MVSCDGWEGALGLYADEAYLLTWRHPLLLSKPQHSSSLAPMKDSLVDVPFLVYLISEQDCANGNGVFSKWKTHGNHSDRQTGKRFFVLKPEATLRFGPPFFGRVLGFLNTLPSLFSLLLLQTAPDPNPASFSKAWMAARPRRWQRVLRFTSIL